MQDSRILVSESRLPFVDTRGVPHCITGSFVPFLSLR